MRLWSIHPKYLDAKGLVALWREGLLAQNVLTGNTKGYRHHPQLKRFQSHDNPYLAIGSFLKFVHLEAKARQYQFDVTKILCFGEEMALPVTEGQLQYEWSHLHKKLQQRDPDKAQKNQGVHAPVCHPLFFKVPGNIADWEVVSNE